MKYQGAAGCQNSDDFYTPEDLAKRIIDHFSPMGSVLDAAMGPGVFYNNYPAGVTKDYCEIKLQRDFLEYTGRVDWIITNPPWSLFRKFLQKGLEVSSNSVWLITVNHLWTKARLRDIKEAGAAIKEIILMPTPSTFPSSGFQLGAIHIGPATSNKITITEW